MQDSNIQVAISATNVVGGLALGLRAKFAPHATQIFAELLDRFKDKKKNVVDPTVRAVDAVAKTVSVLARVLDDMSLADVARRAHGRHRDGLGQAESLRAHPDEHVPRPPSPDARRGQGQQGRHQTTHPPARQGTSLSWLLYCPR